jgi:DNA-binding transcriptional LysR family regulator
MERIVGIIGAMFGLSELEAVVVVARCRNFRAAANELGRSRSALSHSVAMLEERLGVRLFNRTTRSVSLTDAGQLFVSTIASAVADIRGAVDAVGSRRAALAGALRIKTFGDIARETMAPIILHYLRRYPEMKLDVMANGHSIDIVGDGFDAGVRRADEVPRDMIAVPLNYEVRMAVVGSTSYLGKKSKPRTPDDLLSHRCIRTRLPGGAVGPWRFARRGKEVAVDVEGPLTLDESTFILDAVRAGVGLAYVRESMVASELAHGRLIRVLEDWTQPLPGVCLYYQGRRNVPAGLRAMIDLIREIGVQPE